MLMFGGVTIDIASPGLGDIDDTTTARGGVDMAAVNAPNGFGSGERPPGEAPRTCGEASDENGELIAGVVSAWRVG